MVIIITIAILVFISEFYFGLFEFIKARAGKYEGLERIINEFIVLLIIFLGAFMIFSLRRCRELKIEINLRRKTEEALKNSKEFSKTVLNNMNDAVSIIDVHDFKLIDVNTVFLDWLGVKKEDVIGRTCYEITHRLAEPCVPPDHICPISDMLKNAKHSIAEHVHYIKGGKKQYFEVSASPIKDEKGKIIQVVHVAKDITERKLAEEALRLSEEKYRTMIEHSNDMIWSLDNQGKFTYFNKSAEEISGYKLEDWSGKSFEPLVLPADLPRIKEIFLETLTGKSQSYEVNVLRENGSVFVLSVNSAPIFESGQVVGSVSFGRDITEQKHLEEELSLEIEVNTAIADLSRTLLLTSSIDNISSLVLEYAKGLTNSRFGFVGYIDPQTGYLICPTLTRDIWDACQVIDKEIVFKKFCGLWGWVLNNRNPLITNSLEDDPRSTGIPAGHIPINRFMSVPAMVGETLAGQVSLANSVRNYTNKDVVVVERLAALYAIAVQRKRAEETIAQLAYHDPLTGLPNRALFNDRLSLAIGYADRNQQKLAIMMMDLDNFKDVNDTLGHNTGDRLLKAVSERMVGFLRKTDTVARVGGDEFVLIFPETTKLEDSVKIADIILLEFKEPFVIDDHKIIITPSIGIAIFPDDGNDAETLVKNADIAMYHAKEQGKNRFSLYSGGI